MPKVFPEAAFVIQNINLENMLGHAFFSCVGRECGPPEKARTASRRDMGFFWDPEGHLRGNPGGSLGDPFAPTGYPNYLTMNKICSFGGGLGRIS